MPNEEQLAMLTQGVSVWNKWRQEHPKIEIDLSGAVLSGRDLREADFSDASLIYVNLTETNLSQANCLRVDLSGAHLNKANLTAADLREATLWSADLSQATLIMARFIEAQLDHARLIEADIRDAHFNGARLIMAELSRACLRRAHLNRANLSKANLSETDLSGADLRGASLIDANLDGATLADANLAEALLIRTNLQDAKLNNCRIYGIAAWDLNLAGAEQLDLIITPEGAPVITVDNLEVAQFIHLLLHNEKIRDVIDTITSKVVLILGRFTPERKAILDAIRDTLRHHDLLPVLFDFQKPDNRDFTETVSTLAHMARFVIADMTEPRIVLEEVPHIVRNIAVPLVPLLLEGEDEPITLYNLRRNHRSVLPTCRYTDCDDLLRSLEEKVIVPAQAKAKEIWDMR